MFLLKILKHMGTIINVLSYVNLVASLLANKTNNTSTKTVSNLFSKLVSILALNFNVSNVSSTTGLPKDNNVVEDIKDIMGKN